jgi:RluA family pseudouridine synthase
MNCNGLRWNAIKLAKRDVRTGTTRLICCSRSYQLIYIPVIITIYLSVDDGQGGAIDEWRMHRGVYSLMITRRVTTSENGKRLHRYIRNLMPNYPLGQIYKMIEQGKVRVNGKRKNQNYELQSADEVCIYVDEETFRQSAGEAKKPKFIGVHRALDIRYEDDELLVVNKDAGLLTHPDSSESKHTLITQVHAYLYHQGKLDSKLFLPAPANRLDRNTSGLVLIGKSAGMLHQLNQWIQLRQIEKYYLTIVQGTMTGTGEITGSLMRDQTINRTWVALNSDEAKEAKTRYQVLDTRNGYSLVSVELLSGRTHQIRSHFQSIGHPLLGDIKYGGEPYDHIRHQLLHAWKVVFPDGRTFIAQLPNLFVNTLHQLQLKWLFAPH